MPLNTGLLVPLGEAEVQRLRGFPKNLTCFILVLPVEASGKPKTGGEPGKTYQMDTLEGLLEL